MRTRNVLMALGTAGFLFCLGALLLETRELVEEEKPVATKASMAREARELEQELAPLAVEVSAGPARLELSLAGDTLFFASGESFLTPDAQSRLRLLAEVIAARYERHRLLVVGHTDDRGDEVLNKALGQRRAQMVADYLAASGLEPENIRAMSMGEGAPVAANDTEAGRARNRRVEVQVKPLPSPRDRWDPWLETFLEVLEHHPIFVVCGALSGLLTVFSWLGSFFVGPERRRIA